MVSSFFFSFFFLIPVADQQTGITCEERHVFETLLTPPSYLGAGHHVSRQKGAKFDIIESGFETPHRVGIGYVHLV